MSKAVGHCAKDGTLNRSQGMPRGWEVYSRDAADNQARYLLARLTRDGPVLMDGSNADPDDCSHSILVYYKDANGRTHAGIEFTEHLKSKANGELAFRDGGMPCYGRYFVTDVQMDAFLDEFPDKRGRIQSALGAYAVPGGSYLCHGKPGGPSQYRRLEGDVLGRSLDVSKRSMREAVRAKAPVLGADFQTLERDFVLTRPLHRLRFEAERVPDAFKNNPVAPKYSFDPEGVREILGDEMSGGGYEVGYRVVFEFAMDHPMKDDIWGLRAKNRVYAPGTTEEQKRAMSFTEASKLPDLPAGLPNGTFLATYRMSGTTRHDVMLSPELMAECLSSASYEVMDGKYVGVIDAPVYATEMRGAMGASEIDKLADDDFPESRSQIQNRGRLRQGCINERPPAGCVWTADLMSGLARIPEKPLDQALHQKYAVLRRRDGILYARALTDPAVFDEVCRKQARGAYMQGPEPGQEVAFDADFPF